MCWMVMTARAAAVPRHACGSWRRRSGMCPRTSSGLCFSTRCNTVRRRTPWCGAIAAIPRPLVRNMNGSWRSGRLDAVLGGDFDLIAAREGAGE